MRPRFLPGVRHTDLFRCAGTEPVYLRVAGWRDRSARAFCPTGATNLVPFGAALVDGLARGREVGPPMIAVRDWRGLETFSFGDSPALADELAALVLAGTKTATCSAASDGPSTEVGKRMVVL